MMRKISPMTAREIVSLLANGARHNEAARIVGLRLGISAENVKTWVRRDRIPSPFWAEMIEWAGEAGIDILTAEMFVVSDARASWKEER